MSHHDVDTSQQKFNNSGLKTTAKPVSSQTGESFPHPDPNSQGRSRFDWGSHNPGKGGEK